MSGENAEAAADLLKFVHGNISVAIDDRANSLVANETTLAFEKSDAHHGGMTQLAAGPVSFAPIGSFIERVRAAVRQVAAEDPRVLCAAVSPDGLEFSFHGTSQQTEMYEVGAALGARAEDAADPAFETSLHGGWTRSHYPPQGWTVVFSRAPE